MTLGLTLSPPQRVYAGFAVYSFAMGNIFPRLPDLKEGLGVGEGALGLGLIGAPVGTLVSLTLATPILERIGLRPALLGLIPLIALFYAVAIHAPTPLALFLLLLPVGICVGATEIILNLEADRTEHLVGRRIMNRAHAFWSIGFFSAGFFGAGMAGLGLSPALHLALVVPIVLAGVRFLLGGWTPAPPRPDASQAAAPRVAAPTAAIMLLVAVTASAMLLEGASLDWSAIYMREVFGAGPFLSGLAVAAFASMQALTRFFADGIVERSSPADVARTLLAILFAGTLVVTVSPGPFWSLLGLMMMGMGSSAIFPLAMSAAAQRTDRSAAVNIAALAQISFTLFLIGPPLLGFVAEHWGLRASFGIGLPLVLLSLWAAGSLGGRRQAQAA